MASRTSLNSSDPFTIGIPDRLNTSYGSTGSDEDFFDRSESGLSGSQSTPPAPRKASAKPPKEYTPISKVAFMLEFTTPDRSLTRSEVQYLDDAFEKIERAEGQQQDEMIERLRRVFTQHGVTRLTHGAKVITPPRAKRSLDFSDPPTRDVISVQEMEKDSGWMIEFLGNLKRRIAHKDAVQTVLLNTAHIAPPTDDLEQGRVTGFHFCPPTHPMFKKIQNHVTNPLTGVWCGHWGTDAKKKMSTFFPSTIANEDHLIWLLSQGEEIVRQDNKAILEIRPVNPPYTEKWPTLQFPLFVEVYKRESGTVYWSVFPIFYCAPFVADAAFHITDDYRITGEELIGMIHADPKLVEKHMQFTTKDKVWLDIAPLLKGSPVEKGILIYFDREEFPIKMQE